MTSEILENPLYQEPHFSLGQDAGLRTCPLHHNLEFQFICTDPSCEGNAFKCNFCIEDQELDPRYLIPILQIQKCVNKTVFYHWPLPESRELIKVIQALSVRKKTDLKYKENIEKYFKELRIEVLSRIDTVQELMKKQAESLWDFDERIIQLYNEISSKEVLKKLMSETSIEIDELSERVKKVIKVVLSNKEQNKKVLEARLEELEKRESSIDFEEPQKIKLELLLNISKITMFPIEKLRESITEPNKQETTGQAPANQEPVIDLTSNILNSAFLNSSENLKKNSSCIPKLNLGKVKEDRKIVDKLANLDEGEIEEIQRFIDAVIESKKKRQQENDQQQNMKVSDVMKLVKCKANHMSDSAMSSIERMLEGVKRYIESFEVESLYKDGYEQEQFSEFNDSEVKRIGEMSQEIKELLKDGELNQEQLQEVVGVGKQIIQMRNQPQQQQQQQQQLDNQNLLNKEGIIDLVRNESNLCSNAYIEKLSKALQGLKFYLESFCLDEIQTPRISWKGLDTQQLMKLGELANQIREINERHNENEKIILEKKNNILGEWDEKTHKKPDIDELYDQILQVNETLKKDYSNLKETVNLTTFPGFEWINELIESTKWKWILPGYKSSKCLKLEEEQNGVKVIQKTKLQGSAVCDTVLDNSLVYSLSCKFNKPISNQLTIQIGLIPEEVIDTESIGYPSYKTNYSSSSLSTDYETIKGFYLNSKHVWRSLTIIHFRFCIDTQSFYFYDESHEHITKVKSGYIDKNGKYRFGISFKTSEDDFQFSFEEVTVYKAKQLVDKF